MIPTIFETFDKHYDLTLLVGTSPTAEFKVCSRTLARKLEFFDKMLYGPFVERKPDIGNWVVRLPETHQESFKLILETVFDTKKIDFPLTFSSSFIATVDYFDAYSLFYRRALEFSSKITDHLLNKSPQHVIRSDVFSASWSFGCETVIARGLREIVMHMRRVQPGQYCMKDGTEVKFSPSLEHIDLENHVASIHFDAIHAVATRYHQTFTDMMDCTRPTGKLLCKSAKGTRTRYREICDAALLGSLFKEFGGKGIAGADYFATQNLVSWSVKDCVSMLIDIDLKDVEACWRDHEACNPIHELRSNTMFPPINNAVFPPADIIVPLTFKHRDYLSKQRRKWGLV